MCSAQKTPISLLQEICAQQGITPEYKLLSVEGAVHAPTFMYLVQVGDVNASATGQSKKKAKHAAAKAVLEKLLAGGGPFGEGALVSDGVAIDAAMLNSMIAAEPCQLTSPHDDGITGNPVGSLQEHCMKERWQPPFYETEREEGLPHERTFQMACYVNSMFEIGVGKSKRLAKRQAAHKMLERLEKIKKERKEDDKNELKVDGIPFGDVPDDVKDAKLSLLATVYSQHLVKFLKGLKTSNGPKLSSLQKQIIDVDSTCVDLLKEISEEHNFEVSYYPIEEETYSGKCQCLVLLSSLPVAICFGTGSDKDEAKFEAAYNALQYLKIMSK